MAVFRIEKNDNYTVMSNYHLKDHSLSLKAKGLLSQMLSLPEDWDYTLSGLAAINREGVDSIRAAVQELEKSGYIQRRQTQDENGKFAGNEYVIHESPTCNSPLLDFPTTEKPSTDNPLSGKPLSENPTELNKDILSKDLIKKKNKKEKVSSNADLLSDPELRELIVEQVRNVAGSEWTRDEMNDVYMLAVELYNPDRVVRKNHPLRTRRSVNRLFGNLVKIAGDDYGAMRDMLDRAISNGWQSVEQPKYAKNAASDRSKPPSSKPRDEVQYRCV